MAGSKTADGEHSASPKVQDARFFVMNGIVKSADLRFKRLPLIPLSSDATTSPLNVHATRDQTLTACQTFIQMLPQLPSMITTLSRRNACCPQQFPWPSHHILFCQCNPQLCTRPATRRLYFLPYITSTHGALFHLVCTLLSNLSPCTAPSTAKTLCDLSTRSSLSVMDHHHPCK
jgi:hypothetical protein